jgi:hypothetical protein
MWTYVSGGSQITKEVAKVRYWEPNGLGSEATEGQLMTLSGPTSVSASAPQLGE